MGILTLLVSAALAAGAGGAAPDHSLFDEILRQTVRDRLVDYPAIRREHREALASYITSLERTDAGALSEREALAFYINLYNAVMIRAVVERFEPGYSVAEDDWAVFDEPLIRLGGRALSLNGLENDVLRARFHEPRVHVALVCAARSCPPLLPRAYRADDLDEVLESNMRAFVTDPERNHIDVTGRRLELSRIFDWYAEDFGGRANLAGYVNRYTEADVADFEVSFLEYSWELNLLRSGP